MGDTREPDKPVGRDARFRALASDYDGTLARNGRVAPATLAALHGARSAGYRLLLVSGRRIDDLLAVFPEAPLFDRIVGENGATLYRPERRRSVLLTREADPRLVTALRARGVDPLVTGSAVVATVEAFQTIVLATIGELGLELEVVRNKGALMVLPRGVDKATGLRAALAELGLSPADTVGVGDAENDRSFLLSCAVAAAVAGAVPALKEIADVVTQADDGAGVRELIARLTGGDLGGAVQ